MSRVSLKGTAALAALLMAGFASFAEAALTAPSLTAAAASTSQVNLSWSDPNNNESGYQVERSLSSTTGFAAIAALGKNAKSFSSAGLSAGTTYYYRVKATAKGNGGSPYSNVASARTLTSGVAPTPTPPPGSGVPVAPSGLAATVYSATQIHVVWTDNSSNETGFKLERGTSSAGPFVQLGTTAANSWLDGGLPPSTTYYYRARAYNSSGDSGYSNTASATTPAGTAGPAIPTGLSASAASTSQINLSWTDTASNESGFKVERSTASSAWAQIGTTGANVNSFASTGLAGGTAYSYRVRAYNTSGDSGYSNTASATTTGGTSGARWSKRYGDSSDDRGQAVAVDGSGNVAITGHLDGASDLGGGLVSSYVHAAMGPTVDVVVAAYTPTGAYRWARVIGSDGPEEGKGIAADATGNVLVTGYQGSYAVDYGGGAQYSRGGYDLFIAKYSSAGSWVWSKTVGGGGYDQGTGIAADGAGNVVVTGYIGAAAMGGGADFGGGALLSAGGNDVFVVKYSPTGAHAWSKRMGSTGNDAGMAIGADASGNVYVGGTFEGTVDFGGGPLSSSGLRDVFVVKYTSAGQVSWTRKFGGSGDDVLHGLAVDSAGDVALAGKFQGSIGFGGASLTSAGGDDSFVAKISGVNAAHVWSRKSGSTGGDVATGVDVDGSNNVVIGGYFAGSVDFGGGPLSALGLDAFAAKYSASGAHLWSKRYGGMGTQMCDGVAVSSTGEATITGFFQETIDFGTGLLSAIIGGYDAFTAAVGP